MLFGSPRSRSNAGGLWSDLGRVRHVVLFATCRVSPAIFCELICVCLIDLDRLQELMGSYTTRHRQYYYHYCTSIDPYPNQVDFGTHSTVERWV